MNDNDDKVGYADAARLTGLKIATLQAMVCRKRIPHFRLGKRLVVFSYSELKRWLETRRVESETRQNPL